MLKIILLVIIALAAIVSFFSGRLFTDAKNKKENQIRNKRIVKVRLVCYIIIMVAFLIVLII